jgi:hypothetical protein
MADEGGAGGRPHVTGRHALVAVNVPSAWHVMVNDGAPVAMPEVVWPTLHE